MPDIDLFNFFRWVLGTVVTIYATVITLQSLWGWWIWLAGEDRYMGILRQYLIVHGLRLRFGTFWGDAVISVLLCIVFFILLHAHQVIYDLGRRLQSQRAALVQETKLQSAVVEQRKTYEWSAEQR